MRTACPDRTFRNRTSQYLQKRLKFTYLLVPVAILLMLVNSFDDMFFLNVITLYFMGTIHIVIAKASLIILTDTEIRPVKRMRYSKIKY